MSSSSSAAPPEAKRRRTSSSNGNGANDTQPSIVRSSSPHNNSNTIPTEEAEIFVPEYDEIGKLLYIDMQKPNEDDVKHAIKGLSNLTESGNPENAANCDLAFQHGGHGAAGQ